jgi:hypothetical protein
MRIYNTLTQCRAFAFIMWEAFEEAEIQFIVDDDLGGFGLRIAKKKKKKRQFELRRILRSVGL